MGKMYLVRNNKEERIFCELKKKHGQRTKQGLWYSLLDLLMGLFLILFVFPSMFLLVLVTWVLHKLWKLMVKAYKLTRV